MQILDGKETAKAIREELAQAVKERKEKGQKTPHLAAVLVGNNSLKK